MDGTSFVDVSKPTEPVVLGFLPTHEKAGAPVIWRDVKVHANHAYIISEARDHGMQVFDLTTLRTPPSSFSSSGVGRCLWYILALAP